ncbi:hypothetical protein TrVE_jg5290 [Triparma verrucosa]|uniref:G-protein coupled receptors family 1 profile domain-containing protein n=1 Tax=Triparma verrucosa TaxID=1606542 RepID=A0A9W7KY22_9STRA|nr:hypothetical protein TrVE_jg5290 [Triparma verrucosa]
MSSSITCPGDGCPEFYHYNFNNSTNPLPPFGGVVLHFFATGNFTTITYGVYNRYYYLCLLKANKKTTKNSLEVIYFSVLLLLLIHALLPVITNAAYGIYYPKPSNTTCFANGGRGIFAHDIFGFLNMLYFMSNTTLIIFASWKSLKIIKSLLLSAVKSTASNEKQVQAERKAALLAIATTLLFLVCWWGVAVNFMLMPFGISHDWPPVFFALLELSVGCTAFNPLLNLYFDPHIRKEAVAYLAAVGLLSEGGRSTATVSPTKSTVVSRVSGRRGSNSTVTVCAVT